MACAFGGGSGATMTVQEDRLVIHSCHAMATGNSQDRREIEPPIAPSSREPLPIIPYQGPSLEKPGEARNSFAWVIGSRSRDFGVPLALIVLGAALLLFGRPEVKSSSIVVIAATAVVVALISLAVMHRIAELELGTPVAAALKLLALATAPAGVGLSVMWHSGCMGFVFGPGAHFVSCWIIFAYLFRTGIYESLMCVAVVWIFSIASWLVVLWLVLDWLSFL